MFEVRHAGGALARRGEGCGALGALQGEFMTFSVGIPWRRSSSPDPRQARRDPGGARAQDSGTNYLNFAERLGRAGAIFGERLGRMREVRDRYEAAIFRANHELGD